MFHTHHKSYIKSLYKAILSEGALFFDDRARYYIIQRTRSIFKDYKNCQDLERVKYKIKEGRKRLHRLEQANKGNHKSILKVLEEVYGRRGKTRHELLAPYLSYFQSNVKDIYPAPFVPHAPRTAPPPKLCPPLKAIVLQDLHKPLEPELPVPQFKPLHVGRKANLLWRHRSMLLDRLQVPLPFETVCEMERKAGAPMTHPLACSTRQIGGPRYHSFYAPFQLVPHLQPDLPLPPRATLERQLPLPESPYMTKKPDLLDCVGEPMPAPQKKRIEVTQRQQRRLFRRLLETVPILPIITPSTLWDDTIVYTVEKSHWMVRGVTDLLQDVPSPQVIEATLKKSNKKSK